MRNFIITLLILTISISSANTLYSGNEYQIDLSKNLDVIKADTLSILGNSSNTEGINITIKDKIMIIRLDKGYKPDNFTIEINGERIVSTSSNGGGSTACYVNWTCSEWKYIKENCSQIRTCEKIPNKCFGIPIEKPIEYQEVECYKKNITNLEEKVNEAEENGTNNNRKSFYLTIGLLSILLITYALLKMKGGKNE